MESRKKSYYEILQVAENAPFADIARAYNQLKKEELPALREAYKRLTLEQKIKAYDDKLDITRNNLNEIISIVESSELALVKKNITKLLAAGFLIAVFSTVEFLSGHENSAILGIALAGMFVAGAEIYYQKNRQLFFKPAVSNTGENVADYSLLNIR